MQKKASTHTQRNSKQPLAKVHRLPLAKDAYTAMLTADLPLTNDLMSASERFPQAQDMLSVTEQLREVHAALPPLLQVQTNQRAFASTLFNFGASCFLNVITQVLCYTRPLQNYLQSHQHSRFCRKENENCIACILEDLLPNLLHSQTLFYPTALYALLSSINPLLDTVQHHDSHECMVSILDALKSAFYAERMHRNSHISATIVDQIFRGQERSRKFCQRCQGVSDTRQAFNCLSLEIGKRSIRTVSHALQQYAATETVNGVYCQECDSNQKHTKQMTLDAPLTILCLHLKRFYFNRRTERRSKNTKRIQFDATLDLTPYSSDSTHASAAYNYTA